MTKVTQDNEPFTFQTLAAPTARVLAKIDEQKAEHGEGKTDADRTDEQKRKAHSDYVAKRVRDLTAFERRARGGKN